MKTINLRWMYPHYRHDEFVDVTDEVWAAMYQAQREMENYERRKVYHRAYYSLEAYSWLENYALEHSRSPEDILLEREEMTTRLHLIAALPVALAHLMLEKSVQGQQLMEELVGLDKGKNSRVFDDFYAYLTQICAILRNNLVDEEKKTLVRFHFRFRLKDKMYSQLCISIPPECKPETMNMQPMQYDDLLKASYDVGHSLIYSVNKSLVHTEPKKRWKNFITAIPSFDGNRYRKNRREHGRGIPFITFGVSVGSSDLNSLLYYMDFHSIERTLADVIEDYLEYFPIDMKAFCEWARENVEYTSDEGGV